MNTSVLVIGAGPAGMMAAGNAALCGCNVAIADTNKRVGRKLMITGKGRCNITNNCSTDEFIKNIPTNGRFLYSAINNFSSEDTMNFFTNHNLPIKTERGNRVFPVSDKAVDVVDTMHNFIKETKCKLINAEIDSLIIENGTVKGALCGDKKFLADKVVLATGGKSYPLTGSVGKGYDLAKQCGHSIIKPKPSLTSLISCNSYCKTMQGLALKNIALKVIDNSTNKEVYSDFGEMLFTHYGISGPVILSASAHMRNMGKTTYTCLIDLKPALSPEQLDRRILRDFDEFKNKDIVNSLSKLLPHTIIPVIIKLAGIPFDTKCNSITKNQRLLLLNLLKAFPVTVNDFTPIEEAIITSGGICVKEINPKTMESKLINNLYFAGEVIDVDGYTGGFNLQIAFSTGYLAGISAAAE